MSIYVYSLLTSEGKYSINNNDYDVYKRRGTSITTYGIGEGSFMEDPVPINATLDSDVILFSGGIGVNTCFSQENNGVFVQCANSLPPDFPDESPPDIYLINDDNQNILINLGKINIFSYNNQREAFHPVDQDQVPISGGSRLIQYYMVGINPPGSWILTSSFTGYDSILIDYSERQHSFFLGKTILNDPGVDPTAEAEAAEAPDATDTVETNTRQPLHGFESEVTANCENVEYQGTTYYPPGNPRSNDQVLYDSLRDLDGTVGLTGKKMFLDPGCIDPNNIADPPLNYDETVIGPITDTDALITNVRTTLTDYYTDTPTHYVIRRSSPGQDWPAGINAPTGIIPSQSGIPESYDYGVFCRKNTTSTTPCAGKWARNDQEAARDAAAEESRDDGVSFLQEKNRICSLGGLNGVLQHCNWEPEGRSSLYRSLPSQCNESCASPYKLWYEGCTPYFEEGNLEDAYRTGRDSIIQAYGNDYLNKFGTFNNLCSNPVPDDQLEIYSSGMPSPPIHCIDSTGNNVIDTEDLLATLRSSSSDSIHPCGYSYEDAVLYYNIHSDYISKSSPHTDTGDHCSHLIFNNAIPSPTRENGSVIQRLIKIVEENTGVNIGNHNDLESNVIPVEVSNLLNRRLFSSPPDVNLCQRYNYLYDSGCLKTSGVNHHSLLDRIHDHCNDLIDGLGGNVPNFNSQNFLNETIRNCRLPPDERYKSGGDLQESYYTFIGDDQFKESTSPPNAFRNTNDITCPSPYQGEYSVTCNYTLDPGVSTVEFTKQCSNQEYMNNLRAGVSMEWDTIRSDSVTINNQAGEIRRLEGEVESEESTIAQLEVSVTAESEKEEELQNKLDKAEELQRKMDEENKENWWLIGILIFALVMVVGLVVVFLIRKKNKKPSTPSSVGSAKAQPPGITDNPLQPRRSSGANPSASTPLHKRK